MELRTLATLCLVTLGAPAVLLAQVPAISALTWLEGHWTGGAAGTFQEEIWSLQGDAFAGLFREMKGGASTFFEIMVIEPDPGGPIMRLRHFGPGLRRAWEEREAPKQFRLTACNGVEAVFEGLDGEAGARLVYRRTAPDALVITGEFSHAGKRVKETFSLTRKPAGKP